MDTKRCSKCKQEKRVSEYYRDARSGDGLRSECKLCNSTYWQSDRGRGAHNCAQLDYYCRNRDEILSKLQLKYRVKKYKVDVKSFGKKPVPTYTGFTRFSASEFAERLQTSLPLPTT
jgi:hypothetical protein